MLQKQPSEKQSPYIKLEGGALSQYLLLTKELRWLEKSLAYLLVTKIPILTLSEHIYKLRFDIQCGKGKNKTDRIAHFKDLLNQHTGIGKIEQPVAEKPNLGEAKPIEYPNSIATTRSGSAISIGEQLAQSMASNRPAQVSSKPLSEEEKKLEADRELIWRKLWYNFRIDYLEVGSFMKAPLEDLKVAISKISQELEDQELPQESGHIIQRLKKELNLA